MTKRRIGRSDLHVHPFCFGGNVFGWTADEAMSFRLLDAFVDHGFEFIDTADVYSVWVPGHSGGESETVLGNWFKTSGKRDKVVLATKVGFIKGLKPAYIKQAVEESLKRLRTDRIDLYQLHRPSLTVPQDETLRAFDDLVRAGKVRYIGCSTFPAWKVMEALGVSQEEHLVRYISEQPPYNLLDRRIENELVPLAQAHGLALLPWSPLAGGILAGRYATKGDIPAGSRAERTNETFRNRITQRGIEVAVAVAEMAAERKLTPSQLALLWVMDQPGITSPILGPRTMQHLEDALPLLDMRLDDADRPLFDALVHPGTAVADFHNSNDWMKARVLD